MNDRRRARGDEGFTLIEIVIAMSLSIVLIGVMVSVLITSMNAADATSKNAHDNTDVGVVSAFLYKDAQAVNLTVSNIGFQSCAATGTPVGSFRWTDTLAGGTVNTYIAAYSLAPKPGTTAFTLTRTLCTNGTAITTQSLLGQQIFTAALACVAPSDCSTLPTMVTLHLVGGNATNPLVTTLSASVRPLSQSKVDDVSAPLSVLILGDKTTCPTLDLNGSDNQINVLGGAIVSNNNGSCPNPITIDPGSTLTPPPVLSPGASDPNAGKVNPPESFECPDLKHDDLPSENDTLPYPHTEVFDGHETWDEAHHLEPGQYFFCNGLELGPNGTIEGKDVFIAIRTGPNSGKGLDIDPLATVNATAQDSGPYHNLLMWVSFDEPATLGLDGAVANYGGLIYTPKSVITFNATRAGTTRTLASNIGGIIGQQAIFNNAGPVNLGTDPVDISLSPSTLATGTGLQSYTQQMSAPGITEQSWTSLNLPPGLSVNDSGTISGTPTCSGTYTPELAAFTNNDHTGTAAGAAYDGHVSRYDSQTGVTYAPMVIVPGVSLVNPGLLQDASVTLTATASNCSSNTSTVVFQAASTASPTVWSTICSSTSLNTSFTCPWSAPDGTYNVRAQAIDSNNTPSAYSTVNGIKFDSTAPVIGTITPAANATVASSQTVTAVVTDNVAVSTVTFTLGTATCNATLGGGNTFSCTLDTTVLKNNSYTLTVTATDTAGNTASKSQTNTVARVAPSIAKPVAGTKTGASQAFTATATKGDLNIAGVTFTATGTGTASCTGVLQSGTTWGCSIDTSTLKNATYSVTATVTDTAGNSATSAALSYTLANTAPAVAKPVARTKSGTSVPFTAVVTKGTLNIASVTFNATGTGTATCTGVLQSGTTYGCSINASTLKNGSYSVTATVTDTGGNTVTSSTLSYTLTNTLASVSTVSPVVNYVVYGTTADVSAVITPGDVAVQSVSFKLGSLTACVDSAPVGNTFDCSINTTTLTDGTTALVVTINDAASNTITATSRNLTVDNTPNTIAITTTHTGSTSGKIESGESFVLTYSTQMALNSILSGLADNQAVTVRFAKVSTSEVATFYNGANTIQMNLGSVNLGTGYAATTATTATGVIHITTDALGRDVFTITLSQTPTLPTVSASSTFVWTPSTTAYSVVGSTYLCTANTVSEAAVHF